MGKIVSQYALYCKLFLVRSNVVTYVTPTQIYFLCNHRIYILFISHLVAQTIGSHVASRILIIITSHHNIGS